MATEQRTLIVKTNDITQDLTLANFYGVKFDNVYGTIDQNRNSIIWKNINIRQVLGDTFMNSYNKFSIHLAQIVHSQIATTGTTVQSNEQRGVYVKVSGLPLNPLYFDNATKTSTNNNVIFQSMNTPLYAAGLGSVATIVNSNFGMTEITFDKSFENIDLKIDLITHMTGAYPPLSVSTQMIGHQCYTFHISGIDPVISKPRGNIL